MNNKKRVLCAMSGGVDSSVAARLLLDAGYDVVGVTMILHDDGFCQEELQEKELLARFPEARDARSVANTLGIEHVVADYRDLFNNKVINPFCQAYLGGLTPNPCVECNKYLKFGALHDLRRQLNCDYLATGHYAQIRFNETTQTYELCKGLDPRKDQSYVLYHLNQDNLAHTLLPLGGLSKDETRLLAEQSGFSNAQKEESQDICFIPDGDYASFIESHARCNPTPGPIKDMQGTVLGNHRGLMHYTIGQRKGLGVAVGEPLFVIKKDCESNTLVVGRESETGISHIVADKVSMPSNDDFNEAVSVEIKINYRARLRQGSARICGDTLLIEFNEPIRGAAPGQAVVLYQGDRVVAGGTIVSYE
ncbi:MAG: tRNA 2-thiouridine(34) synthase MnmA [Eggerthellaceae bacterium]|nr:tRNA 2-thiouridine(34) synthase MnmA [Eggerthellaceae bacterium]